MRGLRKPHYPVTTITRRIRKLRCIYRIKFHTSYEQKNFTTRCSFVIVAMQILALGLADRGLVGWVKINLVIHNYPSPSSHSEFMPCCSFVCSKKPVVRCHISYYDKDHAFHPCLSCAEATQSANPISKYFMIDEMETGRITHPDLNTYTRQRLKNRQRLPTSHRRGPFCRKLVRVSFQSSSESLDLLAPCSDLMSTYMVHT